MSLPTRTDISRIGDDDNAALRADLNREVLAHQETRRELEHLRRRFTALIEHSREAIGVSSAGAICYANLSMASILGYDSPEEMVGLPVEATVAPQSIALIRERAPRRASGDEEPTVYEHQGLRKDGTAIDLETHVRTYVDEGELFTVVGIRDISERKRIEAEIRRREQLYETLAQSAPVTVWTTHPDGKAEYLNHHWYDYTGSTSDDDPALVWIDAIHPDDRSAMLAAFTASFTSGEPLDQQHRLRRASDGMYRWQLVRSVPVRDDNGELHRWFGTIIDIHDQKQSEVNQRVLAQIGSRLRTLTDPEEILWQTVCLLGEHLQVSSCLYVEIDSKNDLIIVHRDYCTDLPTIAGTYPVSIFGSILPKEAEAGERLVYNDLKHDPRSRDVYDAAWAPLGVRALASIPAHQDGVLIGSLSLHSSQPRVWTDAEVALVEQVMGETRLAMQNALLQAKQRAAVKQTEESLALLDALLSAAPVGFGFLDRDFRYAKVNDALAKIIGIPKEEVVGRTAGEVVPDIWPKVRSAYEAVISSGLPIVNNEVQGETPAYPGQTRSWLSNYYPVKTLDGDILGIGIVVTDITSRKETEDTIRELNETLHLRVSEFQTLFDIVPIGIAVAADRDCTEIHHNPTLAAWLSHPAERNVSHSAAGAGFKVLQDERELRPEELPLQLASSRGEEIRDWQGDFLLPDASIKHLLGFASPVFDKDGEISKCIGVFVDITQQKQNERERERHLHEVELLNVQLKRAMSETHHRVKNNLQVITAMLDMQEMQHHDELPVQEIGRLKQHIRTLAAVHDLLTQSARTDADMYNLSLRDTVDKLAPMIQQMVHERSIRFDVEDVRVPVRQTTSVAVLVNELVSNAVKHGRGDIEVTFRATGGIGTLTVSDQGAGFGPNFDSATAANTGLELVDSLTRWDLRGKVTYRNADDGGATVALSFPLPPEHRTEGEQ